MPANDYETLKRRLLEIPTGIDFHACTPGILATTQINETLSGWTRIPPPAVTTPDNHRSQSVLATRRLAQRDSFAWRSKERVFEFSHYADVALYMTQYRMNHGVGRRRGPVALVAGAAARVTSNPNFSKLQLQFWKCDACESISSGCVCTHSRESKTHVGPFTNDLLPGGRALKPHLKPKTSVLGMGSSLMAKMKAERDALSSEGGMSVMHISGLSSSASSEAGVKRKGMLGTEVSHLKRRAARARSLRSDITGEDGGAESVVDLQGKSAIGTNSNTGSRRFPQELSLNNYVKPTANFSSGNFMTQIRFEDTRVGSRMSCTKGSASPPRLIYRLSRPPSHSLHSSPPNKGKKFAEIARHSALVTPLLPHAKSQESNQKHSRSPSSLGNACEKPRKLGFVDCRQTPDPVEGIRKELSFIRRNVPSRGGGWRGGSPLSPCRRSAMGNDLSLLLNVQGSGAKVEKKISVDNSLMIVGSS